MLFFNLSVMCLMGAKLFIVSNTAVKLQHIGSLFITLIGIKKHLIPLKRCNKNKKAMFLFRLHSFLLFNDLIRSLASR